MNNLDRCDRYDNIVVIEQGEEIISCLVATMVNDICQATEWGWNEIIRHDGRRGDKVSRVWTRIGKVQMMLITPMPMQMRRPRRLREGAWVVNGVRRVAMSR